MNGKNQEEKFVHVGWRSLIGGKWVYFHGTMDPREVHDNGKPHQKVYVARKDVK